MVKLLHQGQLVPQIFPVLHSLHSLILLVHFEGTSDSSPCVDSLKDFSTSVIAEFLFDRVVLTEILNRLEAFGVAEVEHRIGLNRGRLLVIHESFVAHDTF